MSALTIALFVIAITLTVFVVTRWIIQNDRRRAARRRNQAWRIK